MDGLEFIHGRYVKLREAIRNWLGKHSDEESWYFQPVPQANSAAWIVPHLLAFEQIKVYRQIPGGRFPELLSPEQEARFRPGAAGYAMERGELMTLADALDGLARAQEASTRFLAALRAGDPELQEVDRQLVFDRYFLNFTHDTEHYGQLKYLTGVWQRRHGNG